MKTHRAGTLLAVMILMLGTTLCQAAPKPPVPDFTAGGEKDERHDWTLGPTGARGWIWAWKLETTDARQILVTQVDPDTPADGVLEVDDVILGTGTLGTGGKPFDDDARRAFGRAITEAEKIENGGILKLLVWRKGKQLQLQVELPVMGSYSDTSPYDCEKSAKILDAGCRHIAQNMKGRIDGQIGALALLASGKKEYLGIVKEYARAAGPPDLKLNLRGTAGMVSWSWGYTNLMLTEYYLATGDDYVLPAIRELSVHLANGQSGVGSWGHGMAWPELNEGELHGRLGGYGALNQAGLVVHMSLLLAKKCGVENEPVDHAIDKANQFFGFYIDKGAIPYGDHRPGWHVHDDNGKNSIAAVLFDVQGHRRGAQFFSRMSVASFAERERGHTGNYFSFLWGALGANRAGPEAAAAYMKELRWYYDLARGADGRFRYQGAAGMGGGEHQYGSWDCTGAYMLNYALPLKNLYMTGKGTVKENELTGDELDEVVAAGSGFDCWGMGIEPYRAKTEDELLGYLHSWSPAVRHRASQALAEKAGDPPTEKLLVKLLDLLDDNEMLARYGACQAIGALKERGAPAVPALTETLVADDVWLRIQATYALSSIGPPAKPAVNALLKLAVMEDEQDPREMTQRYLAFGLFYPGGALRMVGLLAHSLDGADRKLLYAAVEKLLENPDGRARGAVGSVYNQLSYEELEPLLPAIHRAIVEPSPSGVMFANGIRLSGLKLLAKHRVKEGIPLCVKTMDIDGWGKRNRITGCLKILQSYGGAARQIMPELKQLEQQLLNHREAKGLTPQIELLQQIMADAEAATEMPELRSIELAR